MLKGRKQKHFYRGTSLLIMAFILFGALIPLSTGIIAYNVYTHVYNITQDGVSRLLNAKALLPLNKNDITAALDSKKLQLAQQDFKVAESDFLQLQQMTSRPDVQSTVARISPEYSHKLVMASHLVQVALDVSRMGQEMTNIAMIGTRIIHSSPLASNSTLPLISVTDLATLEGAVVHANYYIDDIQTHMSQVRLNDLPISTRQKTQLAGVLAELPRVRDMLIQAQNMTGAIGWLLGVGHQRRFLVQTMDRAELRPGGGFTGQYGILQIQDGRMAPFNLRDVALLDYAGNGVEIGRSAPPEYSRWMNFGNWGLRDSNLAGDFPTNARMNMRVFEEEGGGPVDGNIAFTPTFIGHILDVIGPIHVAEYGETITSKNLEERLHYYQQDYSAIALQRQKTHDNSHAVRKAFTSLVGKLLLDRIRHLSVKQLLEIVKGAIKDIQSRDLEIYFANPIAEQWLADHGYSGGIDKFVKQDGFMLVQANISISKASQYVHTAEHDNVTIDAQGGATHHLTITLNYQQTGPVYGYNTYADYLRVYVPQTAQFISGNGFDTGRALCSPAGESCNLYKHSFPSNARYCPDGNYDLGMRGYMYNWSVDSLGAPTALTSDFPGLHMWGGLTATPKNCISYITLSWYVPHAVTHNTQGQPTYAIFVQKQGGYVPTLELNVDTHAFTGLQPFNTTSDLVTDTMFKLQPAKR